MANPNIALSFKSPQFRSPLDTAARVQQLAANAMATQKAQRETGSLNALRDYISGGGKLDTPEAISAAIQAGADPDTVRALATQNLDVGKFQADRKKVATGRIFNRLPAVDRAGEAGNDQAWVDWLNAYGALGDEEAAEAKVYLNLTGGKYDPAIVKSLMAGAEKYFEKTTPQAQAELTYGLKGEMQETRTGGITGTDQGVYPLQSYRLPTPTAPRKGTVMVEPSVTVEPGVGGPMGIPESTAPMMPGAKSPRLSASMANSLANLKSDADYKLAVEAIRRADPAAAEELLRIMPVFDPAKAEGIREAAMAEFEVIPQGGQPGLVTGERGGMGGPFIPTGQQAYGKNPMQSPAPGVYSVPTTVIREKAAAERPSDTETYGKKRAEEQATSDVKFLEGIGAARESAQTALGVIDSMIGDARLNKSGQIEIKGPRRPHPGFEDVIGATWRPGARFISGTNAADFDAYLEQVEGGAFLEAYERLKGTGQITEVEGQKATRAITRMKRSVSEPEFVKAAREFEGIIRSALARADAREARLRGKTPTAKSSGGKRLRYNPATGEVE